MSDLYLSVDPDLAPFQQIIDQFRGMIERGELRAGDRLPTVRQLARDLRVAPNTVARAYAELAEEGWVTSDGRRGTSVAPATPKRAAMPNRARAVRDAIAQFVGSLVRRGFSEDEIEREMRRYVSA